MMMMMKFSGPWKFLKVHEKSLNLAFRSRIGWNKLSWWSWTWPLTSCFIKFVTYASPCAQHIHQLWSLCILSFGSYHTSLTEYYEGMWPWPFRCRTPMPTQPSLLPGSVNEEQFWLGRKRQGMVHSVSGWTWDLQIKQWDSLRTCAIPEHLRGVFTTRRYIIQIDVYLTLPHLA